MKRLLIAVLLLAPGLAFAQSASPWIITGGGNHYLKPVTNLLGLQVPGLATTTTGCLSVNASGWITPSGSACGTGGAGSVGNWFNPFSGYNATTSVIGFLAGLFSNSSTTLNGSVRLPGLSNGQLAVNAGLVYSAATTTFNSPLNYASGAVTLSTAGTWSGLAGTASALAADGSNCSAGNFPLGVDTAGAVQTCTDAWTEAENTAAAYINATQDVKFSTTSAAYFASLGLAFSTSSENFYSAAGLSFSTTSTDYWLTTKALGGFSTTSANYWSSVGLGFSTTSSNYWKTANDFFSTSSATYFSSLGLAFSTSSANAWSKLGLGFSTSSADYWGGTKNYVVNTRALTVAGTASQITSSAGSQDLSADRTWTLSLPSHVIFPGTFQAGNATTTNATSTSLGVTNLVSCDTIDTDNTGSFHCGTDSTGGTGSVGNWFVPATFGATASNATSTLIGFNNGLYSLASSTIGNGTGQGGLTINGDATTTGVFHSGNGGFRVSPTGSIDRLTGNVVNISSNNLQLISNGGDVLVQNNSNAANSSITVDSGASANDASNFVRFKSGGQERARITGTGAAGFGTTSPYAQFAIQTLPGSLGVSTTLFAIASSTASATTTLFAISNTGAIFTSLADGCVQASIGILTSTGTACGSGAGSVGNWFVPNTNFNTAVNSTSTLIWFTQGIQASSTSQFNKINIGTQAADGYQQGADYALVYRPELGSTFVGTYDTTWLSDTTRRDNTFLGAAAFKEGIVAGSGSGNVLVGSGAAGNTAAWMSSSTIIGAYAGRTARGARNTILGSDAGNSLSTGASNILIGSEVDSLANNTSQSLNIGNLIYGTGVYNGTSPSSVATGGTVGVGTSTPATTFAVQGGGFFSGDVLSANLTATGTLTLTALTGTQCLHEVNGVVSGSGSDCGTSAGSVGNWFTPQSDGNATSTELIFSGGFLSTASSTINGNATTTGNFAVGSLTINGSRFNNANISQWTNDSGYLAAVTADAPLSGSGTSASHLIISQSGVLTNGYLSSTDWNAFNARLSTSSLGVFDKGYFFSTTSANYWSSTGLGFATSSASAFAAAGLAFSTTSADYWKTSRDFFSTSSASYFTSLGLAFSTSSINFYSGAGLAFSTTSANAWSAAGLGFSTTSNNYYTGAGLAFSTTSSNAWSAAGLGFSTTSENYYVSVGKSFSTTSANAWSALGLGFSTSSNGYFTAVGLSFSTTSSNAWSALGLGFSTSSENFYSGAGLSFSTTSSNAWSKAGLGFATTSADYWQTTKWFNSYPFPGGATSSVVNFTGGLVSNAPSTTITNLLVGNSTTTNATTTSLAIGNLTQAACDVKATTAGVIFCGTDATSGGGSVGNWFVPNTNFNTAVNSTSTPIWFTLGLFASSTSRFATGTGIFLDQGGMVFNVKAYGATGDGTTDDTAAITTVLAKGGTTFFPAGTYLVTGLTLGSGAHLRGVGFGYYSYAASSTQRSIIKLKNTSNADVITIPANKAQVTIEQIEIDGNKANNASGKGIDFLAAGAAENTFAKLQDVEIHDTPGMGIYIGTNRQAVYGNFVTITAAGEHGMQILGTDATFIKLLIGSSAWKNLVVGAPVTRIIGGDIWSAGEDGIVITSGEVTIESMGIDHNNRTGITVDTGSYNVSIVGNQFHSNGQTTTNTYADILTNVSGTSITGNQFGPIDGDVTNKRSYAIQLGSNTAYVAANGYDSSGSGTGYTDTQTNMMFDGGGFSTFTQGLFASSTVRFGKLGVFGQFLWDSAKGLLGIGTSTPRWQLQSASSTAPQLALTSDANSPHWTFNNIFGNLFLATSSPTTFATSTTGPYSGYVEFPANGGCIGCTDIMLAGGINLRNAKYVSATTSALAANAFQDIYTVPTGRRALFTGYSAMDNNGTAVNMRTFYKLSGNYYFNTATTSISQTTGSGSQTSGMILEAGEIYAVYSDTATSRVAFRANFIEYDATVPLRSVRVFAPTGVSTSTLYTVPANTTAYVLSNSPTVVAGASTIVVHNTTGSAVNCKMFIVPSGSVANDNAHGFGNSGVCSNNSTTALSWGLNNPVYLNSGDTVQYWFAATLTNSVIWMNIYEH